MGIIFHIWTVQVVDSVSCTRKNVFYTLPCLQYKLHGTFTNNNKGPIRLDNTITVPWGFMVYNKLVLGLHAQSKAAIDHKSQTPKRSTSQHAENILYSTMEGLVMSWVSSVLTRIFRPKGTNNICDPALHLECSDFQYQTLVACVPLSTKGSKVKFNVHRVL